MVNCPNSCQDTFVPSHIKLTSSYSTLPVSVSAVTNILADLVPDILVPTPTNL